jgi:hypothetical protein
MFLIQSVPSAEAPTLKRFVELELSWSIQFEGYVADPVVTSTNGSRRNILIQWSQSLTLEH